MSIAPEQVKAPAADAVLFRSSPVRTFVAVFLLLMISFGAVSPIVALSVGGTGNPWWRTALEAGTIGVLAAGGYAWSTRGSITTWVRCSSGGLEVAAQGSDPILLAWADVASVVVRRVGMRSMLEVTPIDPDRVHPVAGDEGWPPMTGEAFTADLTEIWPGPRALRRELARRLPPMET